MAIEKITDAQKETADIVQSVDQDAQKQQMDKLASQAEADAKALADKANQAMAETMYEIEDDLIKTRKTLDGLLNKNLDPRLDPDAPEFDLNYSIGDINKMLAPLMAVTDPLASVCGQVPIVGQLPSMMATIQASAAKADEVDPAKIAEIVPEPPEVSPVVKSEISKILEDIQALCAKLPMMLINLIFKMIDVIYSKLKIITLEIPLGSFFPLNLIGAAITGEPTMEEFVTQAPSKVKDMAMGAAKKVQAAQVALAVPTPPANIPSPSDVASGSVSATAEKVADAKTNASPVEQIASPVNSSIPETQPTPPIQVPTKDLDAIEAEWQGEFAKQKVYVFEQADKSKGYVGTDFRQYVPRFKLDDEWEHIKKCVEFDSLKDPKTANYLFKEIHMTVTNANGLGYQLHEIPDYRGYDLKTDNNGKTITEKNTDGIAGRYSGNIQICGQGYIDEWRLTESHDTTQEHIEMLKEDSRYSTKPKYKEQVDKGIAKYGKFLDKYYYFNWDKLPGFASTMIIGRNDMKYLDVEGN